MTGRITAFGIVSRGCPACGRLKADLKREFGQAGYELEFLEAVFEDDPQYAAELAVGHGLDDIPSFSVCDRIFKTGFGAKDVREAIAGAGRSA
jgi:hypothetical protein